MLRFAGEVTHSFAYDEGLERLGRLERGRKRLDRLAVAASAQPALSLLALLLLNVGLSLVFLALGLALFNDPAEMFRELMPGTWLSFAELVFIAAIAWAIHVRADGARGWGRVNSFWALSAFVFLVLAVDEITQATVFLADWLSSSFELSATGGFRDLDAVLLTLLFAGCGLVLLSRAGVLRRHPRALALFFVAGVLGLCSQSLDAFLKATEWEFVAEESFKLAAEPFFVAGYLVALHEVLKRARSGADSA